MQLSGLQNFLLSQQLEELAQIHKSGVLYDIAQSSSCLFVLSYSHQSNVDSYLCPAQIQGCLKKTESTLGRKYYSNVSYR